MSYFNQETQGYIDRALNTLQLWFGSGTGTQQPTPPVTPPRTTTPPPKKDKTLTYVGIGAGVIVVGLVTFVIIKKRK